MHPPDLDPETRALLQVWARLSSDQKEAILGMLRVVFGEPLDSGGCAALASERQLKRWSQVKKPALIAGESQTLKNLAQCRKKTKKEVEQARE